jgi:D-aspartate ligase
MSERRPPAVLLGGDSNALSAARTLAAAGVDVHAVGSAMSPVRYSRSLGRYEALGIGEGSPGRWLDWLEAEELGAVLIPCCDDGVELVARNRERLTRWGYTLPEMDDDLALAMLDKERSYELARSIGVAAPKTVIPAELARIEDAVDVVGLPCALKPRRTPAAPPPGFTGKAFVVATVEELASTYAALQTVGIDAIVTEIVHGADHRLSSYWSYVDADGNVLLELTKHKLRQQPVAFGTGCYQITGWDEDVAEVGRRFVSGTGLVGFSAVEFKRRAPDGRLTLIECNHRLVDANEAVRVAGVDVARVVYERALDQPVPRQPPARDGIRFLHPLRDLRALRAYRRRGEVTLTGWARSLVHRQVTPYFSWRDPAPTAMVAVNVLRRRVVRSRAPVPAKSGGRG